MQGQYLNVNGTAVGAHELFQLIKENGGAYAKNLEEHSILLPSSSLFAYAGNKM